MDDPSSFQSHRNETPYFTNSQVNFSNYYSYPSPNNTNQSFYMYESSSNHINTCTAGKKFLYRIKFHVKRLVF